MARIASHVRRGRLRELAQKPDGGPIHFAAPTIKHKEAVEVKPRVTREVVSGIARVGPRAACFHSNRWCSLSHLAASCPRGRVPCIVTGSALNMAPDSAAAVIQATKTGHVVT